MLQPFQRVDDPSGAPSPSDAGVSPTLPSPRTFNPTLRRPRRPLSVPGVTGEAATSVPGASAMGVPGAASDATPSIPASPAALAPAPAAPPATAPTPVPASLPAPPSATPAPAPTPSATGSAAPPIAPPIAAPTAPALPNPGGIVPTTPIDPGNDLRSTAVLPTDTPALSTARSGLIGATGNLANFDRLSTIQSLMAQFGGPSTDVASGAPVDAAPSEQGALDTVNGQVAGAAGKVAGYDRNTDVASLRDALTKYFGNTDVQAGGNISTAPSDRLSSYNSMLDASAGKLAGVDRVALAKDLLSQFDDQQLPEHDLALRQLTEQYAAKGGGRSGMLRTAYGNEDLQRQRDRDAMKKSLISSALEGSIQDQFNKTNALSSLQSSTAAQDAGLRGEQRTDRGYQTDVATGNVTRGLATRQAAANTASNEADANYATKTGALNSLSSVQGATAGREAARRGELRTERDTATGLAERNAARRLAATDSTRSFASGVAGASAADAATKTAAQQNLFDTLTSEGANQRAETRGERAYQGSQENQSYGRALTEQELAQQQKTQETARQLALASAGENGNPASTLTSLANGSGLDPNLIASLGQTLGQKSASSTSGLDAILAQLLPQLKPPTPAAPIVPGAPATAPSDIPPDYTY